VRPERGLELETDVGATDPFIDANGVAYQLVSRMFVWFGYTLDDVPYVAKTGDRVDATAFEQ
jgi:hypothetical protein